MKLSAGERVAWPAEIFCAKQSDLLASMDGVALFRIPADLALPGIPTETVQRLGLALLATQNNRIDQQPTADTSQGMLWLQQELERQETDTLSTDNINTPNSLIELLEAVYQQRILTSKTRIDSHTPLSAATELIGDLSTNFTPTMRTSPCSISTCPQPPSRFSSPSFLSGPAATHDAATR